MDEEVEKHICAAGRIPEDNKTITDKRKMFSKLHCIKTRDRLDRVKPEAYRPIPVEAGMVCAWI